jgi:hypothetical protein
MALYLDHYVISPGVDPAGKAPRHRVRHRVISGTLGGMTIADAVREVRKDVFKPLDQRMYALRVLTDPDAP